MIRLIWLFLVVAAIAVATALLASQPGQVAINWGSQTIRLTPIEAAAILAAVIVVLVAASRLLGLLFDWPGALYGWRRDRRRRAGYQSLAKGMVAVAAGDARSARRFEARAGGGHDAPLLAQLLAAQAAQLEGNDEKTVQAYADMLGHPETEFLGLRGLFIQASRHGENAAAQRYVARAYALKPKTPWVLMALFDLSVRRGNWAQAEKALDGQAQAKLLDGATVERRRAVLAAATARELMAGRHREAALTEARKALAIAPDLQPAALVAAQGLLAQGRQKRAAAVIERAWKSDPHPDLALLYKDLHPWPQARFDRLIAVNPTHPESWLLSAAEAAQLGRYREAEGLLRPLLSPPPLARACRLMADIAAAQGDAEATQLWTERALSAPRDGVWRCAACRHEAARWAPACPHCAAFDTLGWNRPLPETRSIADEAATALYRLAPPTMPRPPLAHIRALPPPIDERDSSPPDIPKPEAAP